MKSVMRNTDKDAVIECEKTAAEENTGFLEARALTPWKHEQIASAGKVSAEKIKPANAGTVLVRPESKIVSAVNATKVRPDSNRVANNTPQWAHRDSPASRMSC